MDNTEETGSGLRSQLEQALATIKEQNSKLEALQEEAQQAKLSGLLSSKGISSKIAKLIPADVNDAEKLDVWLDEYADVFGIGNVSETSTVSEVETGTGVPTVKPEVVNANRRVNTLNQNAISPEVTQDFEARIKSAASPDEVDAIIKEAQSYFL